MRKINNKFKGLSATQLWKLFQEDSENWEMHAEWGFPVDDIDFDFFYSGLERGDLNYWLYS